MQLANGTLLQGGKYRIEKVLGQGGFGITYLAIQSGLDRKVAIKEFFMKELCERDESTSYVTMGTQGSKETVCRFREKFVKEARNIAKLNHPHIVRVIDIFEENGTAYYVMEYAINGSLADKVKREGYLTEPLATRYIKQMADALDYIHARSMNHLDIKPGNIMLNEKDEAVLIDFGLSKQYDSSTGNQTSTTPVGISEGYAPMEQYKQGGVGEFSPETDIYALGATFFKLLTGITPPSASDVYEDGLPVGELHKRNVSKETVGLICKAMECRKKDRIPSMTAFENGLKEQNVAQKIYSKPSEDETTATAEVKPETTVIQNRNHAETETCTSDSKQVVESTNKKSLITFLIIGIITLSMCVIFCNLPHNDSSVITCENDSTDLLISDYAELRIGDYLYNDGRFSHEKIQDYTCRDMEGRYIYCLGIVYSLETSESEKQNGWNHGQIIALEDEPDSLIVWGKSSDIATLKNCVTLAEVRNDMDGYANTKAYCQIYNSHNHHAKDYNGILRADAMHIGQNGPTPQNFSFSGWYLPSSGQWMKIFENLGHFKWTTFQGEEKLKIDNGAGGFGIEDGDVWEFVNSMNMQWCTYWSSTENGSGTAIVNEGVDGWTLRVGDKDNINYAKVRKVAAF